MKIEINPEKIRKASFKVATILIIAFIFMLLWNWLCVPIFELPIISYLQALGLYLMANVVFKSPKSLIE